MNWESLRAAKQMRHYLPGGIGFEAETEDRIYSIIHIAMVEILISLGQRLDRNMSEVRSKSKEGCL